VPEGHITWHTTGDAVRQVPISQEVLQAPREALFACARCHQYAFTYPSRFGSHIVGVPADALSASDGAAVSVTVHHIDSRHWEDVLHTAITAAGAADVAAVTVDPPLLPAGGQDWEGSIRDAAAGAGGGSSASDTHTTAMHAKASWEAKGSSSASTDAGRASSVEVGEVGWGEGDTTPPLPPNADSGSEAGDSDVEEPTPPRPVRHLARPVPEQAPAPAPTVRGAAAAAARLHRAGFPTGTAQHHAPAFVYAQGTNYHSDGLINTARFMDASLPPRAISGSGLAAPLPVGPLPPHASSASSQPSASSFNTNSRIVQSLGRKLPRGAQDSSYASHTSPSSGVSPLGPLSGAAPQHSSRMHVIADEAGELGTSPESVMGGEVYSPSLGRSSPFAPVVYDAANMRKVDPSPSPPSAHSLRSSAQSSAASSSSKAAAGAAAALSRLASGGAGGGAAPVAARRLAMSPAIGQEQSFAAATRRAGATAPSAQLRAPPSAGSNGSDVDKWWRRTASGALVSATSDPAADVPTGGSAATGSNAASPPWCGVQGLASSSPPGTPSRSPQSPPGHDLLNTSYLSAASAASARARQLDWSAGSSVPSSARGTPAPRGSYSRTDARTPASEPRGKLPASPMEYAAPQPSSTGGRIRGGVSEGVSAAGVGPTGAGIDAPRSSLGPARGALDKTPTRVKPGRKGAAAPNATQGAVDRSAAALTALVDGSPGEAATRPGAVAQKGVAATSPAHRTESRSVEATAQETSPASVHSATAGPPQPAAPMQAPAAASAAARDKRRSPAQNNIPQPTPQRQGVPRRSYLTRTAGVGGTRVHSTADGVPLSASPVNAARLDSMSPGSDAGSARGVHSSPRAVSGAAASPGSMAGMLSAPVPGTGSVSAAVASAAVSAATGGSERPELPPPRSAQRDAAVAKAERAAEESRSQMQARAEIAQHNAHTGVAAAALTGVRQPKSPHRLGPKSAQPEDESPSHSDHDGQPPSPTPSGATRASNPGSAGGGAVGKGNAARGSRQSQAHSNGFGH